MLQVQNDTPFIASLTVLPDERGVDTAYVMVKATFDIQGGALRVAAKQCPLVVADEYWGTPGQSSLKYASEAHLLKPHTDVVLIGEAHAPRGRPVESCLVGVRVGDLRKVIQVGHVPPSWAPRVFLAGTYDDTWRTTRAPYLPLDFKREFFQTASEGLRGSGHLKGGELVELVNVSPEGALRFALPRCALGVSLFIARKRHDLPLQLETVQLEPVQKRLCMLWRSAVPCDKQALMVRLAHIQLKSLEGAS